MRPLLTILILFVLCSCEQKNTPTTAEETTPTDSSTLSNSATSDTAENKTLEPEIAELEKNQAPLKSEILKKSFLQEMYIKNVITISNDSLYFNIPFNLHSADCGAPDCYSNDISFSFTLGDKLIFPKSIAFQEREHGCVDREQKLSGNFQLVEETPKHVIYYSAKHKRTLVLFSSNKKTGTTAFYFTGVEKNRINGKNVYNVIKDYNEEDENSIYPFTSTGL